MCLELGVTATPSGQVPNVHWSLGIGTRGSSGNVRTVRVGRNPSGNGVRLVVLAVAYVVWLLSLVKRLVLMAVLNVAAGTMISWRTRPVIAVPSGLRAVGTRMAIRPAPGGRVGWGTTSGCQPLQMSV